MSSPQAFLRNVESEAYWKGLAPWLRVASASTPLFASATAPDPRRDAPRTDQWRSTGYLRLDPVLDASTAASLARAVTVLRAHDMHPTFLYVYDEAWQVVDALRPWIAPLLGDEFEVLADVWAWHIDPRTDRGGWPVHRGVYEDVRDAAGLPELVNVWIALTDVTERNACMHIVPLSRDPHYPDDLDNLTALESHALALPIGAGGALVWSANAAHWGGGCDRSFDQPRISMSFTLRRGARRAKGIPSLRLPLSFRDRLDLIADQFETYGHLELAPERHEIRWAKLVAGMREASTNLARARR